MPYPFSLPTTSNLVFSDYLKSYTHPSLILAATTHRFLVRSALKRHKRLASEAQSQNISAVASALDQYIPYVLALDEGLSGKPVNDEEIDVILEKEIEVEWRPANASIVAGSDAKRVKGNGLDYEIAYILCTRAFVETWLARIALRPLYSGVALSLEQRKTAIVKAKDHLLNAESWHKYLSTRIVDSQKPSAAVDIKSSTQSALSALALAEATLLVILSQDPYPAASVQERDKSDMEWMYKAPEIPKVRASLCGRLAVRAAEYCEDASSLLASNTTKPRGSNDQLLKYLQNLQMSSKAKACRFFGIEAEMSGKVGEGISWLLAGKKVLGYDVKEAEGGKIKGLSKLKMEWTQKREDRKVEKGREWGSDAGKVEETRVIEGLEQKYIKANDLVSDIYFFMKLEDD